MSGEIIIVRATSSVKSLESSGASIPNAAVVAAGNATPAVYDIAVDGSSYPDAEFVLGNAVFATAPSEGLALNLYARPIDVDGTADTEVPEAARPTIYVGAFIVNNVTTAQTLVLNGGYAADVPAKAEYYVHNAAGQTLSAGWTLKATPRTRKAAP